MKPGAVFAYWWNTPGHEAFPQFHVLVPGHELHKSTVGIKTLETNGFEVPAYPSLKLWKDQQRVKALDNVAGGGYTKGGNE